VTCGPSRMTLFGRLRAGLSAPRVRLADGRIVTARVGRLSKALGGGRAFLAVVPRRARTLRLHVPGSPDASRLLDLPPAQRQCGYEMPLWDGLD
jgi:hypothetical protein